MTIEKALKGTYLELSVENDSTPGQYDFLCGMTSRSMDLELDYSESKIPVCGDPDAPALSHGNVISMGRTFSGDIMTDQAGFKYIDNWATSNASKKCKIVLHGTGAEGGGHWSGDFKVTTFSLSGDEQLTGSLALKAQGATPWTDAT